MPSPLQPPQEKSPISSKKGIAAWFQRVDRASAEINPLLTVLAVGLIVLNLTLYIGMAAADGRSAAAVQHPGPQYHAAYAGGTGSIP